MRILFDDICFQGIGAHSSLAAVALSGKLARSGKKVLKLVRKADGDDD